MTETTETFNVLVNDEEMYTVYPSAREVPAGWKKAGKSGTREECMTYVNEVWTDMRPRSLREANG